MNSNSTVAVVVESGRQRRRRSCRVASAWFVCRPARRSAIRCRQRSRRRGERLPVHDRGKVLTQAMLMLAGGGEACSDIEHLRAQPALFGAVPSDSTLYRTLPPHRRRHARRAAHGVRRGAGQGVAADGGDDGHVDRRVGHRRVVARGALGEQGRDGAALQGRVRVPSDLLLRRRHRRVSRRAVAARATPGRTRSPITSPCWIRRSPNCQPRSPSATAPVTTRAWCAGRSRCAPIRPGAPTSSGAAGERNVGFAVIARKQDQVHAAISRAIGDEGRWRRALTQDGEERPGAEVAELTDLVDLSDWPPGTRLIVRREPLHPGAQGSLFPSLQFRYWGHYTDAAGRRRRRRPRRAHARPRPRRRRHQTAQRLRRRPLPVRRHRRQPGLARRRRHGRRLRALVPTTLPATASSPSPNPRRCAGRCGTPPPASSATPANESCASSTAGPPPTDIIDAYRRVALIT